MAPRHLTVVVGEDLKKGENQVDNTSAGAEICKRKKKRRDCAKSNNSMLTIYWTVELDLRFCPQAIDGWID